VARSHSLSFAVLVSRRFLAAPNLHYGNPLVSIAFKRRESEQLIARSLPAALELCEMSAASTLADHLEHELGCGPLLVSFSTYQAESAYCQSSLPHLSGQFRRYLIAGFRLKDVPAEGTPMRILPHVDRIKVSGLRMP
jgi:hypothetical protein